MNIDRELILSEESKIKKYRIENTFSERSYNVIASYLAKETRVLTDMKLHEVCNHASESLSFSHKVAAKGLIDVLLTIQNRFGPHAFNCLNKNNITTDILLRFFDHLDNVPFLFRPLHVPTNIDLITSLFLKIIMDFKPYVFPKFSIEKKCNYRIRNHRNIRDMGICVLKNEKEFLSFLHQYVRISGVKSKKDLEENLKKDYQYQSRGLRTDACSKKFVNTLAYIKDLNENPKTYLKLDCYIHDKIIKELKMIGCLNTSLSQNMSKSNSINCCKLISSKTKLKKSFRYSYSIIKIKKMFLIFSLYQNKLNIPFEQNKRYQINDKWVGHLDIHSDRAQLVSYLNPRFHMQKKFDFWNWFKSCKNCFAEEMIRQISISTVREIQHWKGSHENFFTPSNNNPPYTFITDDNKMPLKKYSSREDEEVI